MDIAALATSMSIADVQNQIGTALLSQSLDVMEDIGGGMVKMMEASVTPHLGQNIDISI